MLTAQDVVATIENPRRILVLGPLATEYIGALAAFGDQAVNNFAGNLMLPPDNPWLCEYPDTLQNVTEQDLAALPQFQFEQDVALFVSINGCSAETKARVLQEMRERLSERIKLMIVYSTDLESFDFVTLQPDGNGGDLQNVGVLFIPHRYASGIDHSIRLTYIGDDPRLGYEGSQSWQFPIEVSRVAGDMDDDGDDGGIGTDTIVILLSVMLGALFVSSSVGIIFWLQQRRTSIAQEQSPPPPHKYSPDNEAVEPDVSSPTTPTEDDIMQTTINETTGAEETKEEENELALGDDDELPVNLNEAIEPDG
jgi:hypothetical protein